MTRKFLGCPERMIIFIFFFSRRINSDALRIRKDVARKIEEIDAVVQVH